MENKVETLKSDIEKLKIKANCINQDICEKQDLLIPIYDHIKYLRNELNDVVEKDREGGQDGK